MSNDVPSPEHVRPTAAPATHDLGGATGTASGLARHPLLTFTVLTLVISWLPVIPYALGLFPAPLLASGPFLAAIVTVAVVGGRKGLRVYFRRLIRWRVGVGWYGVAFLAPVAGWAIVASVNVLLGAAPPTPAQLAGWSLIVTATLGFLINPLGGAWEEPGWRGYALPLLLRRHSALMGSAVLGVMWALWHLPLFLTGLIPWPDAALVFALSFVFTAIYLRTAGSVLIAFLLHASINGAGEFFLGLFAAGDRVRMYWIMAALCAVVVIAAIVVSRDRWRRVPAVGDNDDAAIGPPLVAEATGIESDRTSAGMSRPRPETGWFRTRTMTCPLRPHLLDGGALLIGHVFVVGEVDSGRLGIWGASSTVARKRIRTGDRAWLPDPSRTHSRSRIPGSLSAASQRFGSPRTFRRRFL